MKTTIALAIALAVQAISAASPSSSASAPSTSTKPTPSIGDKMAQDLVDKFAVFRWEGNNTFARESFAFELNEPTQLQVIDFKHHGDMFDVYDHGKILGSSQKVVYDENIETYAATPQEALLDDHFSKGTFSLDKGAHNITILAHGPYQVGSAALRLLQRTNLVLAKGSEEKEEEEEEEEGEVEEESEQGSDWKKVYLGRKGGKKHFDHRPMKKMGGAGKHHIQVRPDFHGGHVGPKTITHWTVVRETAIPFATRLAFEHDKDY
ncbi:hypothetical protein BC941DRAFT_453259 [Chlamydoabsidia padenii]|nr:hypothetical protein BC941DRAFT_453259 [Chlamydoabsidia padenii]